MEQQRTKQAVAEESARRLAETNEAERRYNELKHKMGTSSDVSRACETPGGFKELYTQCSICDMEFTHACIGLSMLLNFLCYPVLTVAVLLTDFFCLCHMPCVTQHCMLSLCCMPFSVVC